MCGGAIRTLSYFLSKLLCEVSNMIKHNFCSVMCIPEWTYQYLMKKMIGNDHLLDSVILDEKLSIDDIAVLIYLNCYKTDFYKDNLQLYAGSHLHIGGVYIEEIESKINNLIEKQNDKLKSKIKTAMDISSTKEFRKDVKERFTLPFDKYEEMIKYEKMYDYVVFGTNVWLVIKSGFVNIFNDSYKRLEFYRDYLRTINQISNLEFVASTNIFSNYIEELIG